MTSRWSSTGDACPFDPSDAPLILLDAVEPEQRMDVLLRAQACPRWAIITSKKQQAPEIARTLEAMGIQHPLLTPSSPKVYAKRWWESGDKRQHVGGELVYWLPEGEGPLEVKEIGMQLPIPYSANWRPGSSNGVYQNHLPSGLGTVRSRLSGQTGQGK